MTASQRETITVLPCNLADLLKTYTIDPTKQIGQSYSVRSDLCDTIEKAEEGLCDKARLLELDVVLDLRYQSFNGKIFAYGTGYRVRPLKSKD